METSASTIIRSGRLVGGICAKRPLRSAPWPAVAESSTKPIVTIDRSDESTAFIKVRCQLPPRYFTDYLVAMKLADGWQIVSKSYRYDMRE